MIILFKLVGGFMIFISCAFFGFSAAFKLNETEKTLLKYKTSISEIKERIFYDECESEEIIKSVFKNNALVKIDNGKFKVTSNYITKNTRDILEEFLSRLGSSEKQSEVERAELCLRLLEAEHKVISNQIAEKARIYKVLGVCIGMAGGILLI